MPPMTVKSKPKAREGLHSPTRNTTPTPTISVQISVPAPSKTAYLGISLSSLTLSTETHYDDILERYPGGGGIPEPKLLGTMANDLRKLSQLAEIRLEACNTAVAELSKRRDEKSAEELVREQANREAAEEKETLKRAAEDDDEARSGKSGKVKRLKERSRAREERPLTHGAHGLARQDGLELPVKGTSSFYLHFTSIMHYRSSFLEKPFTMIDCTSLLNSSHYESGRPLLHSVIKKGDSMKILLPSDEN